MSFVHHDDPFVPFDEEPDTTSNDSPGHGPGNRRCAPIPDALLPTAVDAARLRVGARTLEPDQWVSAHDQDWEPTLAMKRHLIATRAPEVVAAVGEMHESCEEVAAGVMASIGSSPGPETGLDALIETALRVADDLCVLTPDANGTPRLAAAVVCSPNRWRLSEKIGADMGFVHAPVARYESDLATPVRAMLARLSPQRPVWRVNWGVSTHPSLFQPLAPPAGGSLDPADMWFRVEWQTLRRLPITGAVLFTIRTHLEKMSDFMERDYAVVHEIADLINKIPEDVALYKGIAPHREALFAYLETR